MVYAADCIHATALILRLEDNKGKEVLFVFVEHMSSSILRKVIIKVRIGKKFIRSAEVEENKIRNPCLRVVYH
jgi:hypothetical protein